MSQIKNALNKDEIQRLSQIRKSHRELFQNFVQENGEHPSIESLAVELYRMALSDHVKPYRGLVTALPMNRFIWITIADLLISQITKQDTKD